MALTVRPDDEVYQFDTVWLGPDEYTLPIQARYVAWGTWLACFLVAAAVLIPIGGGGPSGVLGSIVWSLALSVVLSRAVMLVVDHERPLRSLPALFSAEARAALAARRRAERVLLVRPGRVRVRETPDKALAIRERQRRRQQRRAARRHVPAPPPVEVAVPEAGEALRPDRRGGAVRPEWTPEESPAAGGYDDRVDRSEPALTWSVPTDEPHGTTTPTGHPSVPAVPVAAEPDSEASAGTVPAVPAVAAAVADRTVERAARSPLRTYPEDEPPRPYAGPVTVAPNGGRETGRNGRRRDPDPPDRQAAVEARILLPVRKDR